MSRSPAQVLAGAFQLQPSGWALPSDPDSVWGGLLLPMATAWSAIEASMEAMLPQVDPRQATTLLPAWQRMLGPDQCGRDLLATTQSQLQTLVYQRLTGRGGQSIPYFLSLAASAGEAASIQEGTWCRAGMMRTGVSRLSAAGNQFNWRVTVAATIVTAFRTGRSRAAERLGGFSQSQAVCPISHAAPAHTVVSFNYAGSEIQ
jgi:uncharacterized protein YmfQ (DUF2313 family)